MKPTLPLLAFLPLAAASLVACDSASTSAPLPLYVAPMIDGSNVYSFDTGAPGDSGGATDGAKDAKHDTSAPVDGGHDAGHDTGSPVDSGHDSGHDGGGSDTGGGHDSGAPDATDAAKATDAGGATDTGAVPCVTDADTCPPVCMNVGTATEGWYSASGTPLCTVTCAGAPATCEHKGTPQQGWYTSTGHGCPPHSTEIVNDPSCQ